MRRFSFKPSLTLKGRKFKGLRGFAGKPFHPPMTDIAIGGFMLAALFDVISAVGNANGWAHDFYRAATFSLAVGLVGAALSAVTGFFDWQQSTEIGTQARRTVNAHAVTMIATTTFAIIGFLLRTLAFGDDLSTPGVVLVLSLIVAGLTILGGTIGGSLAFDYGFNVETAGDHPVWHKSEEDYFHGDPEPSAD